MVVLKGYRHVKKIANQSRNKLYLLVVYPFRQRWLLRGRS